MKAHQEYVRQFQRALKAGGKSPSTIESYCRDAEDFLTYLRDESVHIEEVEAENLFHYQESLTEKEKENSIRRKIIGIRQFFRFLTDNNQSYNSPLDSVPIPERDETLHDGLEDEDIDEINAVLDARPSSLKTSRDRSILYLLALEGLKATEIINLKWEHLLIGAKTATICFYGSRPRTIEIGTRTFQALRGYKDSYDHKIDTFQFEKDHMFVSFKGKDASKTLSKMSRHGLKFLLYELGDSIGLKHLNTELLRHYAVQHQLQLGKTPSEVMAHFGLRRLGNIAKHVHKRRLLHERT